MTLSVIAASAAEVNQTITRPVEGHGLDELMSFSGAETTRTGHIVVSIRVVAFYFASSSPANYASFSNRVRTYWATASNEHRHHELLFANTVCHLAVNIGLSKFHMQLFYAFYVFYSNAHCVSTDVRMCETLS